MKRIAFYSVHTPTQLLMAGKGWEIRAYLRQLARTGLTLEEYLRRINALTAPNRSRRPKNKRDLPLRLVPSPSSHRRDKGPTPFPTRPGR